MRNLFLDKRVTIVTAIGVALIGSGVYAYQVNRPVQIEKPIVSTVKQATKEEEPTKSEQIVEAPVVPVEAPKPVAQAPVATQQPAIQAPTVRTYDQLIADYGYEDFRFALDQLKMEYPDRFTEAMIEDTFAYIKRVYFSPHSALGNIRKFGWEIHR